LDHDVRDILRCDDLSEEDIAGRQESNRFAVPALAFSRMNSPCVLKIGSSILTINAVLQKSDRAKIVASNLISDALPFGWLWYGEPNAVSSAIDYVKVSRAVTSRAGQHWIPDSIQ
jgi:hypothetical protein